LREIFCGNHTPLHESDEEIEAEGGTIPAERAALGCMKCMYFFTFVSALLMIAGYITLINEFISQ
jgi:hypothetical protein